MSPSTFFVCAFLGCLIARGLERAVAYTLLQYTLYRLRRLRGTLADPVAFPVESHDPETEDECSDCHTISCRKCGARL